MGALVWHGVSQRGVMCSWGLPLGFGALGQIWVKEGGQASSSMQA